MSSLGHFCLTLAWLLSLFGFIGGALAAKRGDRKLFLAVRGATISGAAASGLAIAALGAAFLTNDYSIQYVWQYSNASMENIYKFSAIWGGMDGSMLLWAFILSVSSAVVAFSSLDLPRKLMPWVLSVINSSLLFFLSVCLFFTNPFRLIRANFIPPDGNGLNPLLQNPYMAIHPPMLYLGFTTFSIPFAFCAGALLAGDLGNQWIRLTRRWTLIAWGFLTVGIVLGGKWAYEVLGWGGFWAWDPVENASFFPWLTGTAFLHSVMVQERKNMLKMWNIWLIILTYALTVFGTFLTRSGVVQSVHAFAETDIGWIFLIYLGLLLGSGAALTWMRRKELASERKIESFLSREAAFLINNLIFLSICFATIWGVMFPVLSEALTGVKQTVGVPFFNAVNVPLFLFLIFLMGVGPLIAWRKASLSSIAKTFAGPFLFSLFLAVLLVWAGITEFYPILSYCLCFFVLLTIFGEFHRGIKVQRAAAQDSATSVVGSAGRLIRRHRSRYLGYIVHLGVVVMTIAITASMAHKVEKEFALKLGEKFQIGRFTLTLKSVDDIQTSNYQGVRSVVEAAQTADGKVLGQLTPEIRIFNKNGENAAQVSVRKSIREDLYLVLAGVEENGSKASFKVFINPLQIWLWIGAVITALATLALVFEPKARTAEEAAGAANFATGA